MRKSLSIVLTVLLATLPCLSLGAAPAMGKVEGTVTLSGRPLAGVDVVLLDASSGAVYRTRSTGAGSFQAQVAPGQYLVTTENAKGLVVGHGPTLLPVVAGRVASASIDLLALAVPLGQEPPSASPGEGIPGSGAIGFSPELTCFVAGEFPLLSALVTPADKVARVRVYFKSALGDAYYYVEAGPGESAMTSAKLPRPKVEASPITYYWQATFTDFGEVTGHEIVADVVESADQCGDKVVAPFGPAGPVQVFSAATGGAIAPAGFAAGALGAGAIAAIVAGAIGAGVVGAVVVVGTPTPGPTPTPTPRPTPTPTPTPRPSPTPTPTPLPSPIPPDTVPPVSPFQ